MIPDVCIIVLAASLRWIEISMHPAMVSATRGRVWLVNSTRGRPSTNGTVVSTMHLGTTIRYRVVSALPPLLEALSTEPSVEDSYVWLMHKHREREAFAASRPL